MKSPKFEKTLETRTAYRGRLLSLRVDTVELPGGRRTTREIVEHPGAVAIVPLDGGGNVVMVRQYRKAVEKELLEIPAGGLDPGEDPEECARRELVEETGFYPGRLEGMGGFYTSPGFSSEYLYLFVATDLELRKQRPASDETIEVVKVPLEQVSGLISSGAICDAKSVTGLLRVLGRQH